MRLRPLVALSAMLLMLAGAVVRADQIVLKDGTVYSGKFVRGDSESVDFRVLGRVENFRVVEIERIVFKTPEIENRSAAGTPVQPPPPPVEPEPADTPLAASVDEPVAEPDPVREEPQKTAPAAAIQVPPPLDAGSDVTLPVGTGVMIRTFTDIDTDRNRVGDVFEASLDQAVVYGDRTVFPRGTPVKGRIAYAKESGKLSGRSQMILELTEIIADGKSYVLQTTDYTEMGGNRANRTAATVGGGAALGAIIGAIAGGGTGAAVGAASGAALGTGVQVLTRGEVLRIPAETILEFRLQTPLRVQVP